MSNFIINTSIPANFNRITSFKKPSQNKPTEAIIDDFFNNTTRDISRLYEKRSIDRYTDIPRFNDRRNVRKPLDTQAVRQNKYDFTIGKFETGFPRSSNYPLCPQKISTVFQNGGTHFTTSTTTISYPLVHNFEEVKNLVNGLSSTDCGCYYIDFTGNYLLNWTLEEGGQLVSSDNPQVTIGTFNFYQSDEYFDIFLYPTLSISNSSYVHVRYRIPVRYRGAYGDWIFWESVLITNSLSETEFVKIINCCDVDIEQLQPLALGN